MKFLLALLPAAGCAALMLVCFRMMRSSEMRAEPENKDVTALREQVASLREELERTRPFQLRERAAARAPVKGTQTPESPSSSKVVLMDEPAPARRAFEPARHLPDPEAGRAAGPAS